MNTNTAFRQLASVTSQCRPTPKGFASTFPYALRLEQIGRGELVVVESGNTLYAYDVMLDDSYSLVSTKPSNIAAEPLVLWLAHMLERN
jgi:hypothetical protein